MVGVVYGAHCRAGELSVLALSSRFDGRHRGPRPSEYPLLSVLALSSRFDGPLAAPFMSLSVSLSVLALSSRFDGRM